MSDENRMRIRKSSSFFIFVLILIAAAGGGYAFWRHYHKSPAAVVKAPEQILTAKPLVESEAVVAKSYVGYAVPINETEVRPYISGFVDKVPVEGGATVAAGDVLVILEQAEYKANLNAAEAAAEEARAALANSSVYYERLQKAGKKAVSQTELDNARAAYLSDKAAVAKAEAAVAAAEVNLDYTLVKAGIDGVVGDVALSKGNYVSPENVLLTIVQQDPMRVVFSVTDKDYLFSTSDGKEMFAGETLRLRLADGKIYDEPGVFRYADNRIDKSTGSVAVYADFANPRKQLAANAYVNVLAERKYRGMVVNKNMVMLEPDGSYIYVAGSDGVSKTAVDILSECGEKDYVLKNTFAPGESVVSVNAGAAALGQKVKIVIESTAAAGEKS